jgi:hypothetical protein
MSDPATVSLLERLVSTLSVVQFACNTEAELQRGIAQVLSSAGFDAEREVALGSHANRIDFRIGGAGGVGIEVKVGGSLVAVTRQLHRYLPYLSALVLVTTLHRHHGIPRLMCGKTVVVINVGRWL